MDFDNKYFLGRQKNNHLRTKMYELDYRYSTKMLKRIRLKGTITTLDVGCSDGEFSKKFLELGPVYGIEINQQQAQKAALNGIKLAKLHEIQSVKPDIVILRGTLQHISSEEFHEIIAYHPALILLLQTPNPSSFVYKLLNPFQIALLTPNAGFQGNVNLISLRKVKYLLANQGLRVLKISKPYLSTPHANPVKDLISLIMCYFDKNRNYSGSWKGNIYRMAIVRGEGNV